MSQSGPRRCATCSTSPSRRLMPRLVLAAQTTGTWRAASRIAFSCSPDNPVVPITTGRPSSAASAAWPRVAAGAVNSIATSQSRNSWSALSPAAMPSRPTPASSPRSCPTAALPGRAAPPASAQPSVATMSAISMRPIRPPQPITPILVSAMVRLPHARADSVAASPQKHKRRRFVAPSAWRGRFLVRDFPLHRRRMALLRSVATVGSYTLVSRAFGFIHDILTAAILGAGPVADAFFVAQRLPNLFRSLFAEGAFNAAFVPLASGALAEGGKPAVKAFAEDAFSVLFAVLLGFVLLAEMFMPWLMTVIAPGFSAEPGKFDLVVTLTRITFPYLLFISLTALQGGLLNAVDRFAAPAATPILLNLFLIAALWLMAQFGWQDGQALAWALSAAGVAQFLWLMGSCARAGVGLRLRLPRLTPRIKQTLRIMGPGVLGAGVTQLNLVISTALASLLPSGSVSYLYYADRLNQLPLGVVGIAVATAILPPLSRQVRA